MNCLIQKTLHGLTRLLIVVLVALFALPAWAEEPLPPKRILMALWSTNLTEYDDVFLAQLKQDYPNVIIEQVFGNRDRSTFAAEVRDRFPAIQAGEYDAIYSWGTTASRIVKELIGGKTPQVFNVVYDPVNSKIVSSLDGSGENITGVTNGVPIEQQLEAFRALVKMKHLCFLFNAREHNANLILSRLNTWSQEAGVTVHAMRTAPQSDTLLQHLAAITAEEVQCDAVYAGADAYLGSQAATIHKMIGDKVPLFGGTARYVSKGWLAAFAPDVGAMGKAAASQMLAVLKGRDAGSLPVILPTPRLFLSEDAAKHHKVETGHIQKSQATSGKSNIS